MGTLQNTLKGDPVMPVPTPEQIDNYGMASSPIMAALEGLNEAQLQRMLAII